MIVLKNSHNFIIMCVIIIQLIKKRTGPKHTNSSLNCRQASTREEGDTHEMRYIHLHVDVLSNAAYNDSDGDTGWADNCWLHGSGS
jgi:hypothetical protein